MAARKATVSMKDVAALAGVSLGTVSNVLNSPEIVAEPTRRRVELAIAKLGWIPNEPARQLRAGRSRSIGMIVMDIANPREICSKFGTDAWVRSWRHRGITVLRVC
jgi:LacI family transcriptional regulator